MRYLSFTIEDYKGVEKTTLDLEGKMEPGIYTLVGLNESGKTTILDAIKFLKDGINNPTGNATNLIPRRKRSSFTGVVKVSSNIILSEKDKTALEKKISDVGAGYKNITIGEKIIFSRLYHYEKSQFSGEETPVEIEIIASKKNSNKEPELLDQEKHPDIFESVEEFVSKRLPPVVYYSDFLYNFPSKIYIDRENTKKPLELFYLSVMEDILASLDIDLTLEELTQRIQSPKQEDKGQVDSVISQMKHKVTSEVFSKWNEIFGRVHENKRIEFEPNTEEQEGITRTYIKVSLVDGPDDFLINERSLGFKWFFSFLLLTIFRKARQEIHEEILYLLDEPASNLHSTAQKKILETIKMLGEENSKLIYTTHSHFLINPEWLEGAFIVKNLALDIEDPMYGVSHPTQIGVEKYRTFAANNPKQKEYFQPILDTLDYQPSNLEMVEPMIIAEGKFDYYTLTYMKKHYFPEYEYLNIYPGGGAGSNSEVIALYLGWSKGFCILHDSDTSGKRARTKYLKEFGEILLSERCITYEEIDSSWTNKDMEKIFNPGDLLNIQKTLYPNETTYKKEHFNEAIQKLLIEGEKINLGSRTLDRFKKIFEKLSEILPEQ